MANIKTITKKLVNAGFSEGKLMLMTEKEIRKTYESYKVEKEESTMMNNDNTAANNSATAEVERDYNDSFEAWLGHVNNLLSSNGIHLGDDKLLSIIDDETDNVSIENGYIHVCGWCAGEPVYCRYDLNGNLKEYSDEGTNFESVFVEEEIAAKEESDTPESIEERVSVTENPAPVSDAKAKTIEVLKLIKEAAVTNHNKGFGTTVSAYMLCAYILQAGYGVKKLKGHEAEITDEQKDTVKKVRQWLIDKGYIKACVYKTNGKSVYTDDYDGNYAASMVHHSKSLGLTCVGISSYKVTF